MIAQNEVVAFFRDPSAGATAAYKEGDFIGENNSMTDVSLGKQIIVNAGNGKARILAYDTDGANTGTKNPHWFAPTKDFLANPNVLQTKDIDFTNSDLVYGNGETVTLGALDITKGIPFKRVGNTIKYDATLAGVSLVVSPITGIAGAPAITPPAPAPAPAPEPGAKKPGALGNQGTGMKGWAWYIWLLIFGGIIALGFGLKALFGGKKGKVVKK